MANWTCTYQNGTTSAQCPALVAAATTGPSGQLTYPMTSLTVGETYRVTVYLEKDTRSVAASVDITVVAGDPARVSIR